MTTGGDAGTPRRRIGLYGGSFNPVHNGHLRTAVEVREHAGLDEVWLIPVHVPPHKDGAGLADAAARFRMLELAVAKTPSLRACDIELTRPGPSFTIDTLDLLREQHSDVDFALVLGFDAFREIHTWKEYERLFASCDLVVTSRPPHVVRTGDDITHFGKLPIAVTRGFCYDDHVRCYLHNSGHRLEFVPVTALDISASFIRDQIAAGRSVVFLTPDEVVDYIDREQLFRSPSPAGARQPKN
jgi:nicotinate-nucleotide adenylyltransferase